MLLKRAKSVFKLWNVLWISVIAYVEILDAINPTHWWKLSGAQPWLFFASENKFSIFLAQNVASFSKRELQILLAKNKVIEFKMVKLIVS